jgi:hypothetical protein
MKEIMDSLHSALAEELLTRVKSGEATASDLSVVRQFLKDNGVDSIPKDGNPLDRLNHAANLPFTEDTVDETAGYLPN